MLFFINIEGKRNKEKKKKKAHTLRKRQRNT